MTTLRGGGRVGESRRWCWRVEFGRCAVRTSPGPFQNRKTGFWLPGDPREPGDRTVTVRDRLWNVVKVREDR